MSLIKLGQAIDKSKLFQSALSQSTKGGGLCGISARSRDFRMSVYELVDKETPNNLHSRPTIVGVVTTGDTTKALISIR